MEYLVCTLLIGAGATAVMDLWTIARRRLFGIALPDYGLVGRWIAYLARGRFRHERIAASPPVRGERLIGWTAHYAIGMGFAAALVAIRGLDWVRQPTLGPALIVGIGSVAAPFLVSAVVLAVNQGIQQGFLWQWFRSCVTTWPVAFPTVTLVAPWVRRFVGRVTAV